MSDYSPAVTTAALFIFVSHVCNGAEPGRVKALSGPEIPQLLEQSSKPAHSASPYAEVRRYSLRNERFKRESGMDVRATHSERGTTNFEVLHVIGSEDIYRRL